MDFEAKVSATLDASKFNSQMQALLKQDYNINLGGNIASSLGSARNIAQVKRGATRINKALYQTFDKSSKLTSPSGQYKVNSRAVQQYLKNQNAKNGLYNNVANRFGVSRPEATKAVKAVEKQEQSVVKARQKASRDVQNYKNKQDESYIKSWEKNLQKQELAERKQQQKVAQKQKADASYTKWWETQLNNQEIAERKAKQKAIEAERKEYSDWWNQSLKQQEQVEQTKLKQRQKAQRELQTLENKNFTKQQKMYDGLFGVGGKQDQQSKGISKCY